MDYKALIEISENRAAMFHTRRDEGGYIHEENCQRALWELLDRAEAAEAAQETLQRAMAEYKERAEKAEQRVKHLDEAMEWAKYASGTWESAYYNAMAQAGKAEKELAAAVSDLETVMAYGAGNLDTCKFCKNAQCYARGGTKLCLPKWRGTEEE